MGTETGSTGLLLDKDVARDDEVFISYRYGDNWVEPEREGGGKQGWYHRWVAARRREKRVYSLEWATERPWARALE